MKVVKRDGKIVDFDESKISTAIEKANTEVSSKERANKELIQDIIKYITDQKKRRILVEDIQDIIEEQLMINGKYQLAKHYITYRYTRALVRQSNTTDQTIKELINGDSEYWNTENSNKNAMVVTTQRDYIAGITSTDITRRFLLPEEVTKAHDEGIIHFHDADYFAQKMHNCCLINLEDMLQNGTIINGVMIEKPHKFITASTIATQIILGVSSSQYGGCTVTLSHLAPFVRDSYNKFYESYIERGLSEEQAKKFAEQDTRKEVEAGVQTFNYQVNSMTNTNGQSPFLSVTMYLGETEEYKEELAMIIEEFLNQRILGFKNKKGVYVTPAFPKLLYVLEEDNITPDSRFWYLTELAAKCTAKRLVPDYISEKKMLEYKKNQWGEGDCYPCMGCHAYGTPIIMADGSIKEVQDIVVGDKVMGPDSKPRTVLELVRGKSNMYQINQSHAEPYIVNEDHILSLVCRAKHGYKSLDLAYNDKINISVRDFNKLPLATRQSLKGYKSSYELDEKEFKIDPYILGLWLGDGVRTYPIFVVNKKETKLVDDIKAYADSIGQNVSIIDKENNTINVRIVNPTGIKGNGHKNRFFDLLKELNLINNKHIPDEYYYGSKQQRSDLLAGLINTDGWSRHERGRTCVVFGNTNFDLIMGAKRIADSLGLITHIVHARSACRGNANGKECNLKDYWHLSIKDFDNEHLMEHKKSGINSRRNFNYSCISTELVGEDEYYGFNLDGDQLYLFNDCTVTHNCRSFLTPWRTKENVSKALNYKEGIGKYYGRFNQGVVTINLPDVALSSKGNIDKFWEIYEERLELCHRALQARHERLCNVPSDVAPIMWQNGALARLDKGETIDKLLYDGYSTISLGYAGLYECVKYMTGYSHTGEGKEFGLAVMQKMNDKCTEWKAAENIDYSVYGTPIESTTYKFAKCLKKRFGDKIFEELDGKDRDYITNSYHVPVFEEIDAFEKLRLESEFQRLSPGGAISYIETPNLQNNLEAVEEVMKFIYNNIMYAELNTKSDYCQQCGFSGEILIDENLEWYCPECGNRDHDTLNVARRTCGYIGSNFWNKGRTQEIKERVLHLDNKDC